jgi:LacI family transcriptional regulator
VINALAVSRRNLEMRFRNTLGRSIYDEIRRVRIDTIAQMLLETDFSIAKIAEDLLFNDVAHFSRFFQKIMGISPQQYRKGYNQ